MAKKFLDRDFLIENVKNLKGKLPSGCKFCAVVKSNAYGHGASDVVRAIRDLVDYFAVANFREATEIRPLTERPILILCADFDDVKKVKADVGVYDMEGIARLKKLGRPFDIFVALDSGMNRLGVKSKKELMHILKACKASKNINVKGYFSHISDVENVDRCNKQLKNFLSLVPEKNKIMHLASSNFLKLGKNFALDMVRFGLSLYSNEKQDAMRVTAKILQIKIVPKGEYIGYGSKVQASDNMRIAVLDIGYADGLMRKNVGGDVLICDKRCKILNVCMSLSIVDLGKTRCKVGENAIILGKDKNNQISSQEIALRCDTIPYEILTNFSKLQ